VIRVGGKFRGIGSRWREASRFQGKDFGCLL
jgi:hypothetical protein